MSDGKRVVGILVGGGPAPGLNGVISAATIESCNNDAQVLGLMEGFRYLMEGDATKIRKLSIDDVSRIHSLGGSILRTSRANPTKKAQHIDNTLRVLKQLNIKYLITIGGDDTAFSASELQKRAGSDLAVAHVPKTIDNDLPLPSNSVTFGFETARHFGVEIVQNLMADARTSPRWYIVVSMGRKAGHLALGIGKAAAATLTVIPEEFGQRTVTFQEVCDIVETTILKRRARDREYGVVVLAEGLLEHMEPTHRDEIFGSDDIPRDEHGHINLDDIELGRKVRDEMRRRFKERGLKNTFINKNLGYELRCADPIPFDREYTRDLGYAAVKYLFQGGSGAVITFSGGAMHPLKFDDLKDPITGRPKIRLLDIHTESYEVARKYMIRLDKSDIDDPVKLENLAKASKLTPAEFKERFAYLVKYDSCFGSKP